MRNFEEHYAEICCQQICRDQNHLKASTDRHLQKIILDATYRSCRPALALVAAVALLVLAVLCNMAQGLVCRQMIQRAEESRNGAIRELAALSLAAAQEKQARTAQAEAYAAVGDWEYIGECRITAYCCEPYAHICGTGDGLTATGIPVTPGIAAVDPSVIPLGSTLIIDGQRYLAADVGEAVKGLSVDIAVAAHQEAVEFGVQSAPVWIVKEAAAG